MNEVCLPPAPNWFHSSALACANDGTVAWASLLNIVVLNPPKENSKIRRYSIFKAHDVKVHSISFSPEYGKSDKYYLISGGSEHIVKIWNLEKDELVMSQSYIDANQKVIAVDWSRADPNLVCSITSEGLLMSWLITYNCHKVFSLTKVTVACMSCCPHNSNIVAVGTKQGLTYIINLQGSGSVMYKIRAHNNEIVSLSWCPIPVNIFQENSSQSVKNDLLLACGSTDKMISIWRAGGDGRDEVKFFLPQNPLSSNQHRNKTTFSFTVICWLEPKILLANSPFGELLAVDLSVSMKKPNWRVVHGEHLRGIFCIVPVPGTYDCNNENWRISAKHQVWTAAQDRKVTGCSITKGTCDINHVTYTHSGFLYCIAACPLDTSFIAYGGGDGMLRIWNLSEPHESLFRMINFWQNMKGRISAIAWHPEKENIVAFGTSEGRIGTVDTNCLSKPSILYRYHHRRIVYAVGWGPSPTSTSYDLYSCGDDELVCYDAEKPNNSPLVVMKNCVEFSWNPEFTCMAMGMNDGSIFFLNRQLQNCGKPIFVLKKPITRFAWHPNSTATDTEFSPMKNYLAVATNGYLITIFDVSVMVNKLNDEQLNRETIANSETKQTDEGASYTRVITLKGHAGGVLCVSWNPHITGQLVSGGYDHIVQVWKVDTQEIIASYSGHSNVIYSCMWSPVNADYIMSGAGDFTFRIWKISDHSEVILRDEVELKKEKSKKKKQKTVKNAKPDVVGIKRKEADNITGKITNGMIDTAEIHDDLGITINEPKEIGNKAKKNKLKKIPVLSHYRKTMTNKNFFFKACSKIIKKEIVDDDDGTDSETENVPLSIHGTKQDVIAIVNNEQLASKEHGQFTINPELSLWTNSLRQQLHDAARERKLNDSLVSFAPMLSVKTWQEMCEIYANQLVYESNIPKAVNYFLCIHKIYRAIEVLHEAKMYREAYVLAKCKLDADDAVIKKILEDWCNHSEKSGCIEDATLCSLDLGDYIKAAKLLAKRKDVQYLHKAAILAKHGGDDDLSHSIADEAVIDSLCRSDFQRAQHIITKLPVIQYRLIHLEAMKEIEKIRRDAALINLWVNGEYNYDLVLNLKGTFYELEIDYASAYHKLHAVTYSNPPDNDGMLWMMVGHEIALAAAVSSENQQVRHIVKACIIISQYEIQQPVKSDDYRTSYLIRLLSVSVPNMPTLISQRDNEENSDILDQNVIQPGIKKTLRSYICLALLDWLFERLSKYQGEHEISTNFIIELIEKCLEDGLDSEAVKFWTTSAEISKLESSLIAVMNGTAQKIYGNGQTEEHYETNENHQQDGEVNMENVQDDEVNSKEEENHEINGDRHDEKNEKEQSNKMNGEDEQNHQINGKEEQNDERNEIDQHYEHEDFENTLRKELENIRKKRIQFIADRISAPSPIIIYSKANAVCSVLPDKDAQIKFRNLITDVWNQITS